MYQRKIFYCIDSFVNYLLSLPQDELEVTNKTASSLVVLWREKEELYLPPISYYETYLSCKPKNLQYLHKIRRNMKSESSIQNSIQYQKIQLLLTSSIPIDTTYSPHCLTSYYDKQIEEGDFHGRLKYNPNIYVLGLGYDDAIINSHYLIRQCGASIDELLLCFTSPNTLERNMARLFYNNKFTDVFSPIDVCSEKLRQQGALFLEKIIEWQEEVYFHSLNFKSYFDLWFIEVEKRKAENFTSLKDKILENEMKLQQNILEQRQINPENSSKRFEVSLYYPFPSWIFTSPKY